MQHGFTLFETLIALLVVSTLILSVDYGLNKLHGQAAVIHHANEINFS